MKRLGGFRAVALAVALAPVFAVLSVVVNTPPAGALTADQRQAVAAQVEQFNDDCGRANPPDECQGLEQAGNDDCTRVHPPDECQGPGQLFVFKHCQFFEESGDLPGGPGCFVLIFNVGESPVRNVVVTDVVRPRTVEFTDFFKIDFSGPEPTTSSCPFSGNEAHCRLGTIQPGDFAIVAGVFDCPSPDTQGVNKATATGKDVRNASWSTPIVCGPEGEG